MPDEAFAVAHHGERRRGIVAFVTCEQGSLATAERLDESAAVSLRHVAIAALDECFRSDIACFAIAESRHDAHLLPRADLLHHGVARGNFNLHDARRGEVELRAVGDPGTHYVVILVAELRALPAFVRNACRGFEQHQRIIRRRHIQPPPREIILERTHVENRIVSAQRELEAELAILRAVARPRIAPESCHHRIHIADEIHRL